MTTGRGEQKELRDRTGELPLLRVAVELASAP